MVVPPTPIADLILGKPRFAFRTLEALLDPMLGLDDTGEFRPAAFSSAAFARW